MELISTIDLLSKRESAPRDNLLPRDAHPCARNMWFKHRMIKPLQYDARKDALNDAMREVAKRWIRAGGYAVAERGDITIGRNPSGEFELIIIKPLSKQHFAHVVKYGYPPHDEYEALHSMHHSALLSSSGNRLSKALYYAVSRDDFDHVALHIEYDEARYQAITDMMQDAQNSEALPIKCEGVYCNWCHYRDMCNNNGSISAINCRTCANVSVHDGRFECPHGSDPCGNHIYHPQLMECSGYTVHGADQARMIIDYGDFVNGPGGQHVDSKANFTSRELYAAAGGHEWHKDENLLELMRVFDGRLKECN